MIDALKEEKIVNKVGGRFKLSTLIQKRMVQLNAGTRPLVDIDTDNKMEIVIEEILQDKIYLDTLVHDPLMLEYLLRLMGPERLALGSDYPFPLGEAEPGALIEATVSDDNVKARLLHGTALEWLNLDKARFV